MDDTTDLQEDTSTQTGADVLLNLESMIKSNLVILSKNKDEVKKQKEMLADILKNDPTYAEHERLAKEAAKVKNATKAQILKTPPAAALVTKIKELALEIKEAQDAQSEYLREYGRISGTNEIEGEEGEVLEIVYVAKLVKKPSKFRS